MKGKKNLEQLVFQAAESHLTDPSFFIVEVQVKGTNDQPKIIVLVDGDKGITINDCSRLSRKVASVLEEETEANFALEVSSPGLDHPLTSLRQYKKNIGRLVKCELANGKKVKGRLKDATGDMLTLTIAAGKKGKKGTKGKEETEELSLALSEILKTKVSIEF